MKDLKIKEIREKYEKIYWGIDPAFGTMNRSEEEVIELDEELSNLIEVFGLEGCDGDIDNDGEKKLEDLNDQELDDLYNGLLIFLI